MSELLHPLHVVPTYAALLAVLFMALSLRVVMGRRSLNTGFGSGGNDRLERRIRVHANFAEYVPFTLLLLAFAELRGASPLWLHLACVLLLLGRLIHAAGLSRPQTDMLGRVGGMSGTQTAILIGVLLLLIG